MPVYDIFEETKEAPQEAPQEKPCKDRFFSALTARIVFFLLLILDLLWVAFSLTFFLLFAITHLTTFCRTDFLGKRLQKHWLSLKRGTVSAVALLLALFSPALGIMVACTYFLMYDKSGIEEVVPTSLQEQFQEFMK